VIVGGMGRLCRSDVMILPANTLSAGVDDGYEYTQSPSVIL